MLNAKLTASAVAIIAVSALPAAARDNVQIAGSSTVLPYATIVAEAFGENFDFPTPVVEGGGSGAGRKKMCEGVGENTIDIANSSSRIKGSDIELCASNGVADIMEVRFGYDGIVFASDIDGEELRLCGGGFGIFGHGNVTCLGEALNNVREELPLYRGQNEQSMGFAAAGYAKQWLRQRFMFCTASAGPGTSNLLTSAALAHALLVLVLLPGVRGPAERARGRVLLANVVAPASFAAVLAAQLIGHWQSLSGLALVVAGLGLGAASATIVIAVSRLRGLRA